MEVYNKLKQPPKWALRTIQAGRLKGKTDINPQWRYQAMTEVYGPCGVGWVFDIDKLWTEPGPDGQVFAFASIGLKTKQAGEWSEPIIGIGGNMLVAKEKAGLHANDEAFKMAVTDALSTAMKMLGVAADIYAGLWDGAKYSAGGPAVKEAVDPVAIFNMINDIKSLDELADHYEKRREAIANAANKAEINALYAERKAQIKETT